MTKLKKIDVNYKAGDDTENCGGCAHFVAPNACSSVSGVIAANGLCDLYERATQEQGEPGTNDLMSQLFGNLNQGGEE